MKLIHQLVAFITRKHAGVVQITAVINKAKSQIAQIEAGAAHIFDTIQQEEAEIAARTAKIAELARIKAEAETVAKRLRGLFT